MATKTISLDLEAWEILRRTRRSPGESFSMIIKRARWDEPSHTAAGLLARAAEAPVPSAEEFARLEAVQQEDAPPEDPWQSA